MAKPWAMGAGSLGHRILLMAAFWGGLANLGALFVCLGWLVFQLWIKKLKKAKKNLKRSLQG